MQASNSFVIFSGLLGGLICCFLLAQTGRCQSSGTSGFGASRPASNVLFEPTISFIRQNLRLITSYVAVMRSIMVGAFERPLITSTDSPAITRNPPPKVPPMDLPRLLKMARN